ncbi:spore cortex biosynthesis protein YabQ [Clostridium sp. CM028]|uniref:spore cortex biosynthesis protein YabQ n=1 Tax=unclassified Clostridium TaxID=2614128 RepID=UPI001C0D9067|nr:MULTISPECIES: spore cortex biosynthesis protein YabQ [unclassified Clostridium]MBU3093903.1 spore cortex biosynthesis protein YabQ [Clostridium sp. CF011]MBW9145055.1 spore cortex biosynthesis protein YabQ [Clostridium sp. CM027]MBW9148535.1 spore cortex biosynthesis protein YabQ [Clostridium sp. CM028]UVE40186.1 spore cortex biosynthesis protein YabQ [Clostridium sp. CM027]WAG69131.1 spore cortex biosynthesis protein YabQ [Clostridium sp. CF011]
MIISLIGQVNLIIFSLLAGIITGVFFDIYRLIRGFENPNKVLTIIQDLLFWTLTSIVVFIFLMYTNKGYINFYVYVCLILGVYLYLKLLSGVFIRVQYKLIIFNGKVFRVVWNAILYPANLLVYKLKIKKKDKL